MSDGNVSARANLLYGELTALTENEGVQRLVAHVTAEKAILHDTHFHRALMPRIALYCLPRCSIRERLDLAVAADGFRSSLWGPG
jgi:hypothetical protein